MQAGRLKRVMAVAMTVLTACFGGLWVFGYMYVSAMACAFSTSGKCRAKMPWQMSGEDLQLFVLVPGAIFLALIFGTVLLWRKRPESKSKT